jgi:biotin carboxyl carrier protein
MTMKYKVTLNGKTYEVEVEQGKAVLLDEYEALAPAPAAAPAAPAAASAPAPAAAPVAAPVNLAAGETVEAPMPGNIIRVDVKQGDTVKAGQILVILEAMKMENEIVSPKDGTVAQVVTSKGSVVDTGAPLVVIA